MLELYFSRKYTYKEFPTMEDVKKISNEMLTQRVSIFKSLTKGGVQEDFGCKYRDELTRRLALPEYENAYVIVPGCPHPQNVRITYIDELGVGLDTTGKIWPAVYMNELDAKVVLSKQQQENTWTSPLTGQEGFNKDETVSLGVFVAVALTAFLGLIICAVMGWI